jgi:GTP-binding protein HflX
LGSNSSRDQEYFEPAKEQLKEVAVLVGVHLTQRRSGSTVVMADLDELERLAETAGASVRARVEQRRQRPDPRSLIGKGKAEQLQELVEDVGANLVIFDNDLTPAQGRNLEKMMCCRVVDRTELILDIFVRHARTRRARLQVGLAQYEYLLPRLAKMWSHLERQAGGIGTRGPGETQIETDRRIIRRRISQMRRELAEIDRQMATQSKRRQDSFRVALVGYTNAGKSSLMNRLTDAKVYVEDQLFATLDATTRRVETSDGHRFLLTDTVGFIRKLPHHLVESFRATLSEVNEANLLLHVVDASDTDVASNVAAVNAVLKAVGAEKQPIRFVFNKMDMVKEDMNYAWIEREYPGAVFTSAVSGEGLEELCEAIAELQREEERQLVLSVVSGEPRSLARLHEFAQVDEIRYEDGYALVRLRVDSTNYGRVLRLAGVELIETARVRKVGT